MRITQWGEYGAHCLAFIADKEKHGTATVNAAHISEAQGIDLLYAQQILQRLRRGGLIESVRGPQGGYKLARPAESITLYDILLAAEGDTFEVICEAKPISPERCTPDHPCNLRKVWENLRTHVDGYLKQVLLTSIMDNGQTQPIQINAHP